MANKLQNTQNSAPNKVAPVIIYKDAKHGRTQTSVLDFKEIEKPTNKWIEFGKKNDFPQELIRIYESSSAYHKNLVNKRAKMIAAAGFDLEKIVSAEAIIFFNNQYGEGNLDKIVKKMASNIALFGGCYLMIRYSEVDAIGNRKIAAIDSVPFEKVRPEKVTEENSTMNWYVSRDWLNKKIKPEWYAGFDLEDLSSNVQILPVFLEECMVGRDYLPLPIYNAALDELKSLYELGVFHLKSVQNGFAVEHIFIHPGQLDPEQQDDIVRGVSNEYSGADNAGKSMHIFPGTIIPGLETQVIPVQRPDTDKRYLDLKEQLITEVIAAHGAIAIIAGKETSGKLGTADEIAEAYEYFQMSEIQGNQKTIEDEINMMASYNGIKDEFILNEYNISKEEEEGGAPVENDAEAQARAQLRGSVGGVQGIIQIQTSVAQGLTDRGSAQALLELIYGFSPEESKRLLGGVEEGQGVEQNNNTNITE